ncbi:MAG: hypothetical protein J5U19_07335 [Candidatus Methanoperedens sp.]|nr:hypothetical protein [Candidatus Methanoperedens sp.]
MFDPHETTPLATTLLKEGYSLSLDDVYDICCQDKTGDYIYYNKTIDGREYTIIESKLDAIFRGSTYDIVQLRPLSIF